MSKLSDYKRLIHEKDYDISRLEKERDQLRSEDKCTCDDFTDMSCSKHQRENQLQNEVLQLTADLKTALEALEKYAEKYS